MNNSNVVSETTSEAMTMYSFNDLVDEISNKKSAARKDKASWERLLSVAHELVDTPSDDENILTRQYWSLERVAIQGYRGVLNSEPLELAFDPRPGVTVLHGLNGAGKSSISDAIESALTGKTPSNTGTGGKAPLWDPIHLGRGASSASIEITLSAENSKLYLKCSLDEIGNVDTHTAELEDESGRRIVKLGDSWKQALSSHQPVFAYASLERRVQLSKDLATYFEGLLALGGSFSTLQETIAVRSSKANESFARWENEKNALMRHLGQIDAEKRPDTQIATLQAITAPNIDSDIDEWVTKFDLSEKGIVARSIRIDALEPLTALAEETRESIQIFETKRKEDNQELFVALETLHTEAKECAVQDEVCPVCRTPQTAWMATLEKTIIQAREIREVRNRVDAAVRSLYDASTGLVEDMIALGSDIPADHPHHHVCRSGGALISSLRQAVSTGGFMVQHSLLTAASELTTWLQADDTKNFMEEIVAQTDELKQWKIIRARATEQFVALWRQEQKPGAEAPLWTATTKRVDDLRSHLRKKRSITLEEKANERVKELLSDAELHLEKLTVLSTKASMELLDENGNQVELGMLSAGQRNAVLLAPLLASVDAGPFGFLVLDDPVHAFDELRIDRLAKSISRLATNRRVIVLTHDERLKEHLAARTDHCDMRLVERSSRDGSVAVSNTSHFWDQLLTDARNVLDFATGATGSTAEVTDTVRALCRLSLDNALRGFVIRNAVRQNRNVQCDLQKVDDAHRTDQRLRIAAQFCPGVQDQQNPVLLAIRDCADYFFDWNRAVHGNTPATNVSKEEIKAARKACKRLEKAN
ncbi:AAA family ATPase [Kocuria sp. CPCC 205231]|uniref:AAA family ATPase n=1 Tax=Kocuria sp. CPCC 205231 TaxID=3073551 RepID=UPI0034D5F0BC